jgi:hypothetical protein
MNYNSELDPKIQVTERFRIIQQLDPGFTAQVFVAEDTNFLHDPERSVVILKQAHSSEKQRRALRYESRVLFDPEFSKVAVEGYAPVLCKAFEETSFNREPTLVMEYLGQEYRPRPVAGYDYQPLDQLIAKHHKEWNTYQVLKIIEPFLVLMAEAHRRSWINGDLSASKAGCLFYNQTTGQLKNIDWGNVIFAKDLNQRNTTLNPVSDIQGIGAILFYMCTDQVLPADKIKVDDLSKTRHTDPTLSGIIRRAAHAPLEPGYFEDAVSLLKEVKEYLQKYESDLDAKLRQVREARRPISELMNLVDDVKKIDLPTGRWASEARLWEIKLREGSSIAQRFEELWQLLPLASWEALAFSIDHCVLRFTSYNQKIDQAYRALARYSGALNVYSFKGKADFLPEINWQRIKLLLDLLVYCRAIQASVDQTTLANFINVWGEVGRKGVSAEADKARLLELIRMPVGEPISPTLYNDLLNSEALNDGQLPLGYLYQIMVEPFSKLSWSDDLKKQFDDNNLSPDFNLHHRLAQLANQKLVWRELRRLVAPEGLSPEPKLYQVIKECWSTLQRFRSAGTPELFQIEPLNDFHQLKEIYEKLENNLKSTLADERDLAKKARESCTRLLDLSQQENFKEAAHEIGKLGNLDYEILPGTEHWQRRFQQAHQQQNLLQKVPQFDRLEDFSKFIQEALDGLKVETDPALLNPLLYHNFFREVSCLKDICDWALQNKGLDSVEARRVLLKLLCQELLYYRVYHLGSRLFTEPGYSHKAEYSPQKLAELLTEIIELWLNYRRESKKYYTIFKERCNGLRQLPDRFGKLILDFFEKEINPNLKALDKLLDEGKLDEALAFLKELDVPKQLSPDDYNSRMQLLEQLQDSLRLLGRGNFSRAVQNLHRVKLPDNFTPELNNFNLNLQKTLGLAVRFEKSGRGIQRDQQLEGAARLAYLFMAILKPYFDISLTALDFWKFKEFQAFFVEIESSKFFKWQSDLFEVVTVTFRFELKKVKEGQGIELQTNLPQNLSPDDPLAPSNRFRTLRELETALKDLQDRKENGPGYSPGEKTVNSLINQLLDLVWLANGFGETALSQPITLPRRQPGLLSGFWSRRAKVKKVETDPAVPVVVGSNQSEQSPTFRPTHAANGLVLLVDPNARTMLLSTSGTKIGKRKILQWLVYGLLILMALAVFSFLFWIASGFLGRISYNSQHLPETATALPATQSATSGLAASPSARPTGVTSPGSTPIPANATPLPNFSAETTVASSNAQPMVTHAVLVPQLVGSGKRSTKLVNQFPLNCSSNSCGGGTVDVVFSKELELKKLADIAGLYSYTPGKQLLYFMLINSDKTGKLRIELYKTEVGPPAANQKLKILLDETIANTLKNPENNRLFQNSLLIEPGSMHLAFRAILREREAGLCQFQFSLERQEDSLAVLPGQEISPCERADYVNTEIGSLMVTLK